MKRWARFLAAIGGAVLAAFYVSGKAQDAPYPKKANIEITVLFPAGTSADITARLLAQGLARNLGVNVLAVNRPGAGGAIGYKYVSSQIGRAHV